MEVFCLIISLVDGFFAGCIFLWCYWVKNGDQEYWNKTYKKLTENQLAEVPEEVIANMIMRLYSVSFIVLCICMLLAVISIFYLI